MKLLRNCFNRRNKVLGNGGSTQSYFLQEMNEKIMVLFMWEEKQHGHNTGLLVPIKDYRRYEGSLC